MSIELTSIPWEGLAVALGSGLLIGLERERRKRSQAVASFAGLRTFALVSLLGAMAQALNLPWLTAIGGLFLVVLIGIAYFRSSAVDAGMTTEVALFVAYLIGLTAIDQPMLAAGAAVVVTALLAARNRLHHFTTQVINEHEVRDGLILASAAVVVLPLVPNAPLSWLAGINPRSVWVMVVLLLGIQALGHVALRAFGARHGLALSGFLSGFVTATGTIAAMALKAKEAPDHAAAFARGALLSNVATHVQMLLLSLALFPGIVASIVAIAIAGATTIVLFVFLLGRQGNAQQSAPEQRRMFGVLQTLGFAGLLTLVAAATAYANEHSGVQAAGVTAAVSGFFDAHAAAASALSLGAAGTLEPADVIWLILIALTTNTISKVVVAFGGGSAYAWRVAPALLAMSAAIWLPLIWL